MKKFFIFLLCGVMLFTLAACKNKEENKQTQSIPHEEGDVYVSYANEPTVDMFIQSFIKIADIQPHNIRLGDRSGEYMFTVDQTDVTMMPQETGMSVFINGGQTEERQEMAFTVFGWCVKAMDDSAGDPQIKDCVSQMRSATTTVSDVRLSMYCKLVAFVPSTAVETVKVDSRIELWGFNYKADENTTRSTLSYNTTTAAAE